MSRPISHPEPPQRERPFARGRLVSGLAGDRSFRWTITDLTAIVEAARLRRDLSPLAAVALGKAFAGAALLLRMATKRPTRLVLEVRGDGPLGTVVVEAGEDGMLRGMVGNAHAEAEGPVGEELTTAAVVGRGTLRVVREEADGARYQSEVELVSGEIGKDIAHYLDQSEQTPSAVLVGVLAGREGVRAAGGMIVEVLPGASEQAVAILEENLAGVEGVSRLLNEGGIEWVRDRTLSGLDCEIIEERRLIYHCRCDRDRLRRYLSMVSEREPDPLLDEDGLVSAECFFCGAHYRFHTEELADA